MSQKLDPRWGHASPFHDPYALANFRPRASDVLITTAPKAGTTWMQQILYQLKSGGDDSFESINDVVPWIEWPQIGRSWQEVLADFETINNPRVFKTHCTYEQTPGIDTVKVILSSRDPRDCCVSFYHHLQDLTDEARARRGIGEPPTFDQYVEDWLGFGAWYRNVKSWWPHRHDENVLWLRYEDMKLDLPGCIDQILEFLGWSISPEQRQRALLHSSFPWMKAHSEKFTRHNGDTKPLFKPGGFIRRGQVGDHRTLLSDEHQRRILRRAGEELEPECLSFLGLDIAARSLGV
ncbi:MAG: sulfotransferase domain-containing protein [Gammaproteobacteria bacterium]|nr:sulfotransferase domain-containing protein [Gammaproteobacteria bacterium]